jgi:hypothetical protein
MKKGKEHRVPLSSAALEVLSKAMAFGDSEFVFHWPQARDAAIEHELPGAASAHGAK